LGKPVFRREYQCQKPRGWPSRSCYQLRDDAPLRATCVTFICY